MACSVVTLDQNVQRKRLYTVALGESEDLQNSCDEPDNSNNVKKPKLSGEEYLEMKQRLKERKKLLQSIPRLHMKLVAENAQLDEDENNDRIPILLSDVQHLLLYSILGPHSPYWPTRWCDLEKYNKLSTRIVLIVEGLSSDDFLSNPSMFPNITNIFQHKLELLTPVICGGSIIEDFAAISLTGMHHRKIIEKFGSLDYALQHSNDLVKRVKTIFPMCTLTKPGETKSVAELAELPPTDKYSRTQLLLSPLQMVEENFPLPVRDALRQKYKHYVFTKEKYTAVTAKSPMFAVDCEMCKTITGELELTRISLINEKLETVYDTLVKPYNKIINYLTQYSGITPQKLENVKTRLQHVQDHLRSTLPSDAILIGHSLPSDLNAMRMMHPYVIDTSVIFNATGNRYRKSKLRMFSQLYLNEDIQNVSEGHCSIEDSAACMKLVQLKLQKSVDFADEVQNENVQTAPMIGNTQEQIGSSMFKHIASHENTAAIIGNSLVVHEYSKFLKSSKVCDSNDKNNSFNENVRLETRESNKLAIQRIREISFDHQFILCHLRLEGKAERNFHNVNKWVKKIWKYSPLNSMFCVIFGGQANSATGACFLNIKAPVINRDNFDESNDVNIN